MIKYSTGYIFLLRLTLRSLLISVMSSQVQHSMTGYVRGLRRILDAGQPAK